MQGAKLFVGIFVAIVLFMAGDFLYRDYQIKHAEQVKAEAEAAKIKAEQEAEAAYNQKVKEILDRFLTAVNEHAVEYKKQRKVVTELVKPGNLSDDKYVTENAQMMKAQLPELQKKMDGIMALFKTAEQDMLAFVKDQPEERQKKTMDSWHALKDKQVNLYLAFFASEQEILLASQQLMDFYASKQGGFAFNAAKNALEFLDAEDKAQEQALRKKMDDLEAEQSRALTGESAE